MRVGRARGNRRAAACWMVGISGCCCCIFSAFPGYYSNMVVLPKPKTTTAGRPLTCKSLLSLSPTWLASSLSPIWFGFFVFYFILLVECGVEWNANCSFLLRSVCFSVHFATVRLSSSARSSWRRFDRLLLLGITSFVPICVNVCPGRQPRIIIPSDIEVSHFRMILCCRTS